MPNGTYEASLAVLRDIVQKLDMEELNNNEQADATEVLGKILEVVIEEETPTRLGWGRKYKGRRINHINPRVAMASGGKCSMLFPSRDYPENKTPSKQYANGRIAHFELIIGLPRPYIPFLSHDYSEYKTSSKQYDNGPITSFEAITGLPRPYHNTSPP